MTTKQEIYWKPIGTTGLEHLILEQTADAVIADGLILRYHDGEGLRLRYRLDCDHNWFPRKLRVQSLGNAPTEIVASNDGHGNWVDDQQHPLDHLKGCYNVDIMGTPFTNTLAIKYLGLAVGEAKEIDVAYVTIPDLHLMRAAQRYTYLRQDGDTAYYLYENVDSDFKAELWVDAQQLVRVYEGQWERSGV